MPYDVGTLVRVRDEVLADGWEFVDENRAIVDAEGYIYRITAYEYDDDEGGVYTCTAIASGAPGIVWYIDEVTTEE